MFIVTKCEVFVTININNSESVRLVQKINMRQVLFIIELAPKLIV